jgi:hypothetical protein
MTQKILIVGNGIGDKSALLLQAMKEKYGDDIVLVTPEEAREQGLKSEDFVNIPSYKITAPPIMDQPMISRAPHASGKEQRRKRREQERKANKKHKW